MGSSFRLAVALGLITTVPIIAFFLGQWTVPSSTRSEIVPTQDRAYADARVWTGNRGKVSYLRRNAVVFNWTVRYGRHPGQQFAEWYLRQDDGTFRLAGVQYLSGLGG